MWYSTVCITPGLGFLLRGMLYPNNSVLPLRAIGDAAPLSLYCLTTYTSCCRAQDGGSAGAWFLPGKTDPVEVTNSEFGLANFSRGRDPSATFLNRRNSATGPSGVYTCQIPDASGQLRTLYIGVDTGTYLSCDMHVTQPPSWLSITQVPWPLRDLVTTVPPSP